MGRDKYSSTTSLHQAGCETGHLPNKTSNAAIHLPADRTRGLLTTCLDRRLPHRKGGIRTELKYNRTLPIWQRERHTCQLRQAEVYLSETRRDEMAPSRLPKQRLYPPPISRQTGALAPANMGSTHKLPTSASSTHPVSRRGGTGWRPTASQTCQPLMERDSGQSIDIRQAQSHATQTALRLVT